MPARKKLLFIHDRLPAEGISGMIIFLRHFKALKDFDIHILIPENAYQQHIIDQYPDNFFVHTFKLRQSWWPPFRESNTLSVKVRLALLENYFKKTIRQIQPDIIVSVLYHYYNVVAARLSVQLNIPLITFLHDCWDNKSNNIQIQQTRRKYAEEVLKNSAAVLSVTTELVKDYTVLPLTNYEVFPPIPEGFSSKKDNTAYNTIAYAGTIEQHHLQLFDKILPVLKAAAYDLLVITNEPEKLGQLKAHFSNLIVRNSFSSNKAALTFLAENTSAILVNYGLNETENPNAAHSFPSKFIEFSHLNLPIIASGPKNSPFYQFLKTNNWPLILEEPLAQELTEILKTLSDPKATSFFKQASNKLAGTVFNPDLIQQRFETILSNLTH